MVTRRSHVFSNSTSNYVIRVVQVLLALMLLTAIANAQDSNPKRGFQPGSSFALGDFETINTTNGNLMLHFPLGSLPGGRGGLSAGINLTYNSKLYDTEADYFVDYSHGCQGGSESTPCHYTYYQKSLLKASEQGGWQFGLGYGLKLIDRRAQYANVPSEQRPICRNPYGGGILDAYLEMTYVYKLLVTFPDGSTHEMRPNGWSDGAGDPLGDYFRVRPDGFQEDCGGTGSWYPNTITYYSIDGSYLRLDVQHDNDTNPLNNPWKMYMPDGSRVDSTVSPQRIYDRNNNYVEVGAINGQAGVRDQFNRSVTINGNDITMQGFGQTLTWTVHWKSIFVRKPYWPCDGALGCPLMVQQQEDFGGSFLVIDSVTLPAQAGGLTYQFSYNAPDYSGGTPPSSSTGWGEISGITLPSGAHVDYTYWQDGTPPSTNTTDVLRNYPITKTLHYDQVYDGASTPITEPWSYVITSGGCTIVGPDGGQTYQSFGDTQTAFWASGLTFATLRSDGSKSETIWAQNNLMSTAIANPYPKTEFTSIKNAAGTDYVKTAIKDYSYDKNGNVTKVAEYDWVDYGSVQRDQQGRPTGIPSGVSPSRITVNSYVAATPDAGQLPGSNSYVYWSSGSPNLRSAVAWSEVRNGSDQPLTRTELTYDNALTTGNVLQQASWDSTKGAYTSSLSSGNSVSLLSQYTTWSNGATGKLIQTTDGRGTPTVLTYGSVGGFDIYPTQIQTAYGTPVQRTETREYDFNTGLVTRVTDVDNNVSTSTTYDVFGRPTLVKAAEGKPEEARTSTEYSDANRRVIVRSDMSSVGDGKLVSIQHFDQLGRVRLARRLEDSATQSATDENTGIKVQTRYLSSNPYSYVLTSNPYRAATSGAASGEGTMGWTRSKMDNAGRSIEVQTFAGVALPGPWNSNTASTGTVTTAYNGYFTTVTDQKQRVRRSMTDGLGRLVRVDEPDKDSGNLDDVNGNPVQPTSYLYDALGNLITVNQGSQSRTFVYSSLGRLTSATNPESGTMNYTYDNNGNLTQKSDARFLSDNQTHVAVNYDYDLLNRLKTRTYNDGTTPASYFYDGQTLPTGAPNYSRGSTAGRLVAATYGATGSTTGDYYAFDSLGRQSLKIQRTDGVDYQTSATYNKAGAVKTQTYPSGHTVSYDYDNAGRINNYSGNLGDGTNRTYTSNSTYSVFGGLNQEQFGTQTPLYHKLHYNVRGQLNDIRLSSVPWATDQWDWNRGAIVNYYSTADLSCSTQDCRANSGSDNNGNLLQSQHFVPANEQLTAYNWTSDSYSYDALNRLKSVSELPGTSTSGYGAQAFVQTYDYDRWGNRTINQSQTTNAPHPNYTVDATTNRLVAPSGYSYTYDQVGNQTFDNYPYDNAPVGGTRTCDADNHLKQAYANNYLQTYSYDSDGRRIKRKVNGNETCQVFGIGGELLAEYKSGAATFLPTKEYGYRGGELLVTMASGDDARLTRFVTNLFYGALHRDPNSSELQNNINQLAAAGAQGQSQLLATASQMARGLFTGTNYETAAPASSDAQYVADLYYAYLQRGPDDGGLNWWAGQVAGNGRANVCNAFEASSEFQTLVATLYGTAASDNERTEHIVNNFYLGAYGSNATSTQLQQQRDALNVAAAQGLAQVQAQLETMGRTLFATQVNDSSISNTQYVTNLYEAFLQRGPDAGGLGFWSGQASVGTGRQNVLNAFAGCGPFRELAGTLFREAFWLVADHLGTPRMIADKSGSLASVKRHDYLPFGEELGLIGGRTPQQGYAGDSVRQKFTQKERDNETGLDYFGARYYGSTQGRFVSADPFDIIRETQITADENQNKAARLWIYYLGRPQQWNKYSYVAGNPLKYIDPSGELLELTGDISAALARIKGLVGAEAAKLLFTYSKNGHTYVDFRGNHQNTNYQMNDLVRADGRGINVALAEIMTSKTKTIEYQVADRFDTKFRTGVETGGAICGGACTVGAEESKTGNTQIFVNSQASAIAETTFNSTLVGVRFGGTPGRIWAEDDVVDAHEFGHAYANAFLGLTIRNSNQTYATAANFENRQRITRYPERRKVIRIRE